MRPCPTRSGRPPWTRPTRTAAGRSGPLPTSLNDPRSRAKRSRRLPRPETPTRCSTSVSCSTETDPAGGARLVRAGGRRRPHRRDVQPRRAARGRLEPRGRGALVSSRPPTPATPMRCSTSECCSRRPDRARRRAAGIERAAEAGHTGAMYNLGVAARRRRTAEAARDWYRAGGRRRPHRRDDQPRHPARRPAGPAEAARALVRAGRRGRPHRRDVQPRRRCSRQAGPTRLAAPRLVRAGRRGR